MVPSTNSVNQLSGVNNGTGTVTVPSTTFTSSAARMRSDSGTWGGQVGFDKQMGHWVLGFEGDLDANYGSRSTTSSYVLPGTALTTGSQVAVTRYVKPSWEASARGRIGWAMGPTLIYGTGGLAWEQTRNGALYTYSPTVTGAVAAANPGATFGPYASGGAANGARTGWTVGGGAEWLVSRHVSVGAEYRHSDFGHHDDVFGSAGPDGVIGVTRTNVHDDAVTARLNYRFGVGS